jgi:DUF1680 family protein
MENDRRMSEKDRGRPRDMNRREFVITGATAAAAAALPVWPGGGGDLHGALTLPAGAKAAGATGADVPHLVPLTAKPFALRDVRLRPGRFLDEVMTNRTYMMWLDPDRLLHMFRVTAGLPSSAKPLGGWEAPDNELRGHFTGHYMSATALMGAQLDDPEVRDRGNLIVRELAKCQAAHGNGYLSAFPTSFFERLERRERVWAPFYTYHKIMAGLLDQYQLAGNDQALGVLKGMAKWVAAWAKPIPDEQFQDILNTEFGGMNEVLYNLYAVTGEESYAELAHRFDHRRVLDPMAEGRDDLTHVHVNTTIPKVIGAARRYEVLGDERYRKMADWFWTEVTGHRSYATGGTSSGEGWPAPPDILAHTLNGYTEETCTTYNMLKLTRHLFSWTADAHHVDFYERALFNGILGTQHPDHGGEKLYYLPLGPGFWRLFGLPLQAFWCCYGTGVENFSKCGDSVYFHDDRGVWVNLFIASEVTWREKRVRIVQDTKFPDEEGTTLTVRCDRPTKMALRLRIPWWTTEGATLKVGGEAWDVGGEGRAAAGQSTQSQRNAATQGAVATPGAYTVVDRTWKDGDLVELTLPMKVHAWAMPDDPSIQALMYGPLVLAVHQGTEGLTPENILAPPTKPRTVPEYPFEPREPPPELVVDSDDPTRWLERLPGEGIRFRTVGQAVARTLSPLNGVFDERYAVYWKVTRKVGT